MNDELTDRLSRQLHDQVDGWHDSPLTLEGVQGRARTIRRRRQAMTSGVVAAAVLAIAVPVGFGLSSRTDSSPDYTSPSPTRVVEQEPSAIGLPYLEGRTLVLPSGEERELPGRYAGAVVLGDTVLAVAQDRETGESRLVREDGTEVPLSTPTLATNSDASAVAYVRADDHVVVESFDGTVADLGDQGADLTPVSLLGGPDCSAQGSCTVWFNRGEGGAGAVRSGGATPPPPDAVTVTDATVDGRLAVVSSVDLAAGGACSAILDGATSAESCDYTYGRFSPDGEHLSAAPAYESGSGDAFVAILDAEGEEVSRFEPGRDAMVFSSTWEDSGHLLVTTYDYPTGAWSVVRLGTDGNQEVALGPSARGDDVTPAYDVLGPTG